MLGFFKQRKIFFLMGFSKSSTTLKQRFEAKYVVNHVTGCWDWTASTRGGYGAFKVDGKTVRAHRFSYELYRGPILGGLQANHICEGNPTCVNPYHIYLGTQKNNHDDMVSQNRQTRVRAKGSDTSGSKLTELQIVEIRRLYETGNYTVRFLGGVFRVSSPQISRIVTRKSWKHL